MSNLNLRNITNNFQDARLVSLASWKQAADYPQRDRGGPYVVLQDGYDPADVKFVADEFVLGRSGKWISLSFFYRMPVPERRAEFIFGTAAEVMQMMSQLAPKVQIIRPGAPAEPAEAAPAMDELTEAVQAAKSQPPTAAS